MVGAAENDVTALLLRWRNGDDEALHALMPLVYGELRKLAGREMRREHAAQTMQPTALVHELYFRLLGAHGVDWRGRAHFFAFSARLMRRVLVDEARRRGVQKRGGGATRVALDDAQPAAAGRDADILAVDDALARLARVAPRKEQVIELRIFGGLTIEETAAALDVSADVVKREWRTAKLWLRRALDGAGHGNGTLERD